MASELLPCPLCGSNQLSFRSTPDMDTDGKYHRISCNECGASSRATFAMDACPLFFEELSKAWNTRPTPVSPDATDKCGELVTVAGEYLDGHTWKPIPSDITDFALRGVKTRALCDRSQAVELLAAERAKTERWHKKAMDAGVIVHSDGATSHPMRKERDDLKADNAALTARVKELVQINASLMGDDENKPRYTTKRLKQEVERVTQVTRGEVSDLAAKLAAAEKLGVRHD